MRLFRRAILGSFLVMIASSVSAFAGPQSIRDFDARAREGGQYNVVFFGGSLTWGANASDPQTTSYRGLMMRYLLAKYPKASLHFHDAAIGGTGSDLGMFRLERDVLAHKPDLVFLDFTANDDPEGKDPQQLAAYERLVAKILDSGSAVMPVLLCFKWHMEHPDDPLPPRHLDHSKIAEAYGCASANVLASLREAVKSGKADPKVLWAIDGVHPDDAGYQAFFEVVRVAYEKAIGQKPTVRLPDAPVFPALYPSVERRILTETKLPAGWEPAKTRRTSLWFDGLSSRWMGEVVVARVRDGVVPASIEIPFRGSLVGLFGERDAVTVPFRVWVDDQPIARPDPNAKEPLIWKTDSANFGGDKPGSGNLFSWTLLSKNLKDGDHVLRIEPLFEGANPESELRIESICSAGR